MRSFFKKNKNYGKYFFNIKEFIMIFRKIAEWITGRKRDEEKHILDKLNDRKVEQMEAPYKVEQPAITPIPLVVVSEVPPVVIEATATKSEPVKCGCGRSPTGYCVGLHKLTVEEWAAHADNPIKVESKKAPAKKPAVKKDPAKKPAAKKAPAKKTATKKKADAVVQATSKKTATKKSKV